MVYAVVVTFNGMQWIDRCLKSLISNTHCYKVVVIDNRSTDGTLEHIRSNFPEVTLVQAEKNLGFGQANNKGIAIAREQGAEHVFLLNQDAWVVPDTIGALVQAQKAHPEFGVLSPMHLNGAGTGLDLLFAEHVGPRHCPGLFSDTFMGKLEQRPYATKKVNAAAWLISSDCIEKVGGFSPAFFHYGEDDNYVQRCHYHGFKVGVIPHAVIYHDREQRELSSYQTDRVELDRREAVLYYSNPKGSLTVDEELRAQKRSLIRSYLVLDREGIKKARNRMAILRTMESSSLAEHRATSITSSASFLSRAGLDKSGS